MLDSFLTVGQQVLTLFILIAVGFFCGKGKFLDEHSVKKVTDILLYIVTPCVIIRSFVREFNQGMLVGILIVTAVAVGVHILSAVIAMLAFRCKDESHRRVLRFGTVFSNCSFMSLPLQQQILGNDGVLYGATFVAIFNLILWSYGVTLMQGKGEGLSVKKIILNPCVLCVLVGMAIFLWSIPLPDIILTPVGYLADLNTPLPMLVIGYYLSKGRLRDAFTDGAAYVSVLLRIIAIPVISVLLLYVCGVHGGMLTSLTISISAPTAAITTMFAAKFDRDTELSVKLVTLSTLLSLITMPVFVAITQQI